MLPQMRLSRHRQERVERLGNPKYKCKSCGFGGVFQTVRKDEAFKEMVVRAAQDRSSSRGLARTFQISYQTALRWIKKKPSRSLTSPPHCCPRRRGMCWNWTNCGRLCTQRRTKGGFGSPFAAVPSKSCRSSSEIAAQTPVGNSGT